MAQSAIDRPLRIAHLTAGSDAGGVSRYLVDLCTALSARRWQFVIAGEPGVDHALFDAEGWRWLDAPLKGGFFALRRAARQLAGELATFKPDIIHAHYRRSAIVGRRVARQLGVPLLFTLHVTDIPLALPHRWLTDFGDRTHVASQDAKQWLLGATCLPASKITVVPHGVDTRRFPPAPEAQRLAARQSLGVPPDAPVAGYVGRYDQSKNVHWTLDVLRDAPGAHLILQGQGPCEAAIRRRVDVMGLGGRVKLLPYGDPRPAYQAMDLLLLPSVKEGFSLSCAEAMSTGRPVLRTQTAGCAEQIIEHTTGHSVPIDHDQFVHAAIEMLSNREALTRLGEAATVHVHRHLRFETQLEQTAMLYHDMAEHWSR